MATVTEGEFKVNEPGNRSRYLEGVARLGVRPLVWDTDDRLRELTRLLSMEL